MEWGIDASLRPCIGLGVAWCLPSDVQRQERAARVLEHPSRANHQRILNDQEASMAVENRSKLRCAYCGRARDLEKVIIFSLLAEGCLRAGIRLSAPRFIAFDPGCARRAFRAIQKSTFEERS